MLDIKFIREHAAEIKQDLDRRKEIEKQGWVDEIIAKDGEWRSLKQEADALRSKRNKASEAINAAKKSGGDAAKFIEEAKAIPVKIKGIEERMISLEDAITGLRMRLPNMMHESVPYGKDDSENQEVALFGKKPTFDFTPKNHTELIESLGVVELERAAKIAGSRQYFLKGDLALLEQALQRYAIDLLVKRGYTLTQPPFMMNKAAYEGVTDLKDFEDVMYKIADEDLYLIATSEHPLTAQFMGETLSEKELPIKLAGISTCFRKEAGSHGKEEKGIWRVHQFNKIEQVVLCAPEESWRFHEELIKNAIDLFEGLELHFRQVNICTGDLGIVAAKKYDLEAWIPSVNAYKEVVSGSNCTSYQSVRLGIRYRKEKEQQNDWVHTLNATAIATSRALVAILEQHQNKDGTVNVPKALQPYMNGKKKIGK